MLSEQPQRQSLCDPALRRWRNVLIASSITTVLAWLAGMFLVAPDPDGTARVAATASEKLLVFLFAAAAISTWVAGLVHAWRAFRSDRLRRSIVMSLLVVGNFFGAMIYLVLFAAWSQRPKPI